MKRFLAAESTAGLLLVGTAGAALLLSNSPWRASYEAFLAWPGELRIGPNWLVLSKPLLAWVNELWMALFFLVVGLEVKREMLGGELGAGRQALMPLAAAFGGIAGPAVVYLGFNRFDPIALRGWAIPAATDIAFALGVLRLLGSRVPSSLKIFLSAVAIIDDLGAILIIALFYTANLSGLMLAWAAVAAAGLWLLNRMRVDTLMPYAVLGLVLWVLLLKSGVHATLAGVLTAFAIPMARRGGNGSLLNDTERALQPWVAYLILPVFAFVNAGVSLRGVSPSILLQPIPLGIAAGLLVGKSAGVFAASWLMVKLAGGVFPAGANRLQFFGMCLTCGIGFTLSLFIGGLAFDAQWGALETQLKLGVLCGSVASALLGAAVLWRAERRSGRPRRYL